MAVFKVWRNKSDPKFRNMWMGCCYLCSPGTGIKPTWQYWNWGATMGYGWHHVWKYHRRSLMERG